MVVRLIFGADYFQYINFFSLLLCIAVSLHQKKLSKILVLLVFLVLFENVLASLSAVKFGNNIPVYNLISHSTIWFYYWILRSNSDSRLWKVGLPIWILFSAVYLVFFSSPYDVSIVTYIIGLFTILLLIARHFYNILLSKRQREISRDFKTWFALGVLLFFTCSFPILLSVQELVVDIGTQRAFGQLLRIGNIFLSLGYLASVICIWLYPEENKHAIIYDFSKK